MKGIKIMKKITREETKIITKEFYISVDGREFEQENDCQNWEKSYKGTLAASWELIKKEKICGCDLGLPGATYDDECYILKPSNLEEITLINAYLDAFIYDSCQTLTTEHINKLICFNFGYDCDFCDVYIIENHLNKITEFITKITNKINGNEENEKEVKSL